MVKFNMENIEGIDSNIETCLHEYGMAWILSECRTKYRFYYGVAQDAAGLHTRFKSYYLNADANILEIWDWKWLSNICSHVGTNESDWLRQPLPIKIFDLYNYYGMHLFEEDSECSCFIYNSVLNRFIKEW